MIIAFAPMNNTEGKKDATGAFVPEGCKFMDHHGLPRTNLILVDNSKSKLSMRAFVFEQLQERVRDAKDPVKGVAFFCHGFRSGIQFGISKPNVQDLIRAMVSDRTPHDFRVTFYACDAGRNENANRDDDLQEFGGDNGFADLVRDELCKKNVLDCVVDAHTTAAHTTMNPDVRRFEGRGSPVGGVGGSYLVPRGSTLWKPWREKLKTPFRFEFPYLSIAAIHDRLLNG